MALVTSTVLKEYMPEIQGTGADAELTALINRVEAVVAQYLGFPLNWDGSGYRSSLDIHTYTRYYDGPSFSNSFVLDLRIKPVHSVTSIHSDPYQEYGSDTLIDSSTYELDSIEGHVRLLPKNVTEVFDKGYRAIKAIFSAGYNSTTAPPDIIHAICVWASQLQRFKANQGKENISQRGGSVTLSAKTMPTEIKQLLQPYRNSGVLL